MSRGRWLNIDVLAVGLGVVAGLLSCTTSDVSNVDQIAIQRAILDDATARFILPKLATLQAKTDALDAAFVGGDTPACVALASDTGGLQLAAIRLAWSQAKDAAKALEPVSFGPVKTLRLGTEFDFWPTRPSSIVNALTTDTAWSAADMVKLSNAAKGLPALGWLLYTAPTTGDEFEVASAPTVTAALLADGARRCHFAAAVARHTRVATQQLVDAWARDKGNYAAALQFAGREGVATGASGWSSPYSNSLEALSDVINAMVGQLHALEVNKTGRALGDKNGGVASPDAVESPYGRRSLADLKANLAGFAALYGQGTKRGLRGALLKHSTAIATDIDAALSLAAKQLDAITPPLATALTAERMKVVAVQQTFGQLRVLFASDVANVFGITVTFTDADGD